MSRFSNSTAAAQRARNLANARATGSKPPMQRGSVPNPADKPMTLPPVRQVPFTGNSGLPSRIKGK